MGDTAENQESNDNLDTETPDAEIDAELQAADESVDGAESDTPDAKPEGEIEIIREGTQPQFTQQQVNDIVNKRVNRLNTKVTTSNTASEQANTELALANEKNKLLELALDQAKNAKDAPTAPNPNDFDGGTNDPEFIKKQGDYNQSIIERQVAEQVARATQTTVDTSNLQTQSQALQRKQVKHYERANEIGAKDYDTTEDTALEILGNEVANHIIDNFDDSHVILYYLGKNPDEANRISSLVKSAPIRGVAELGRLSSELKIKPKTPITPDPDEDIKGDTEADKSALDRKLDKLREQAAVSGDMTALMEFKRKHKL